MRIIYKGAILKVWVRRTTKDSAVPQSLWHWNCYHLLFQRDGKKGWFFGTWKRRESQSQLLREDQWLLIRDIASLKQPCRETSREIMTLLSFFPHSYLLLKISAGQTNQSWRAHSPIYVLHTAQPSGRELVKGGEWMWRGNWHRHTVSMPKNVLESV